jgi:hypothetical protein
VTRRMRRRTPSRLRGITLAAELEADVTVTAGLADGGGWTDELSVGRSVGSLDT